jgi:hypothetical protein
VIPRGRILGGLRVGPCCHLAWELRQKSTLGRFSISQALRSRFSSIRSQRAASFRRLSAGLPKTHRPRAAARACFLGIAAFDRSSLFKGDFQYAYLRHERVDSCRRRARRHCRHSLARLSQHRSGEPFGSDAAMRTIQRTGHVVRFSDWSLLHQPRPVFLTHRRRRRRGAMLCPHRPERRLRDFPWTVDSSSAHGNALSRLKLPTERARSNGHRKAAHRLI